MTITTGTFIERANKKHNNKYSYTKTEYFKYHEKVIITCSTHGDFEQSPAKHLAGQNCPKCARISLNQHLKFKWTKEEEDIIRANYNQIGLSLTAELLNTNTGNTYRKARSMGLTKKVKPRTYHDKISKVMWNSILGGAYRRRLVVEIIEDDIWDLYIKQNKKCALTGLPITLHKDDKINCSVDRIDSSKGYTKDNIQLVLKEVNKIKMDLDQDRFYELCKTIYLNLKEKMETI